MSEPSDNMAGTTNGSTVTGHAINAKDSLLQSASSAFTAVANHPTTQKMTDSVTNGPVADSARAEGAKTKAEFADLANSRTTPGQPAATGQPLTHYHSMFYRLLSWKNPRATGISFAAVVLVIFTTRYLNIIRYIFKALYITLGVTASAELAGQLTIGKGVTSQFRPRQYFTIPKASLERLLDDLEQFINFFVIESQRIVFAENVYATVAAFFASLISYFLIKWVPLWGLSLIATTVAYLGPLIYLKNKEVIDAQLEKGYNLANEQATQLKHLASQHTGNAAKTVQGYTQQYTAKAQETINSYRGRSASPEAKRHDLPAAPTHQPIIKEESSEEESDDDLIEPETAS
ncbi:hypothetical protein P280DRAFT_468057 [Massarina eburnea CBS 473.64]|uniref:Reticulon-like protein n=1 Tax=Massarina eburnea CBS 473.64 TaxID=1395130 RepID=A0A6A6S7M9_9PLEO|nr:hypothetical protein P280DRAFT_468057 [Massarina eburnea CBS 473.64]